ncbi:MAG: helix-turn-helix domain-containing protein [Planctomycetaceae bacterium]|nr:helix-turn-helix domain-containing protein [Planctomycetaceae bacterium]
MKSESHVMLIREVAELLRVSNVTIYRWVAKSRKGEIFFPHTISPGGKGSKLRWLASEIENYIASQSVALPVASSVRQAKREQKDFLQRQADAEKSLEKHRINRSK